MNIKKLRHVIFDLDGTLLDTAPDLALALNLLLQKYNKPTLSEASIRPMVAYGSRGLLQLAFNMTPEADNYDALRAEYLQLYLQNIYHKTKPFDGIKEVLIHLNENHLRWSIVTNKPQILTHALLKMAPLLSKPDCVVSGDTLSQCKPNPAPLLYACKHLSVSPAQCLYIGDAECDVIASRSAGMAVVIAKYGYLGINVEPGTWAADAYIKQPKDLITLLSQQNQS